MNQEPEQSACGVTHYAGCACHEQGWQNRLDAAVDMAARAQIERDDLKAGLAVAQIERDKYRTIAGELIAAIRVNTMRGTFKDATIEQVDEWLSQWISRM